MQAIYAIEGVNNTIYIGQTKNLENRSKEHKTFGKRYAKLVGVDWTPDLKVLAELPDETTTAQRRQVEDRWAKHFAQFKTVVSDCGTRPPLSEETRRKISEANKGRHRQPKTQEHKDRISAAHLGKKHNYMGNNKLTPLQVRVIRRCFELGLSCILIGKVFKVQRGTIYRIRRGQTWR